jgi:hypothetical protein
MPPLVVFHSELSKSCSAEALQSADHLQPPLAIAPGPIEHADHAVVFSVKPWTSSTTPSSLEAPRSIASINLEPLDAGDLTGTLAKVSLSLTFISDRQISIQ